MKTITILLWLIWLTQIATLLLQDARIVEIANKFIEFINQKENETKRRR